MKSSISSRKRSSPVQRQTSATAAGNLRISSVLKSYEIVPSGFVRRPSRPNQIEPSDTTSWTTTPERALSWSEMSRSARRWSSIASNWPSETEACAVYSPSTPNSHG